MGNTTIIEINHDYASEIRHHPAAFAQQVLEQCGDGSRTGERIHGGRVIAMFHRSESPIYNAWLVFVEKAITQRERGPK